MVIGEGPGETEDRKGKPWQGKAGRLNQETFRELGWSLGADCISLNAVNCRTDTDNRTPTGHEIACCRAKIVSPAIRDHAPKVIITMGAAALASVLGPLCSNALGDSIGRWRGFAVPVPEWGAWVCPTYHPSYVLREDRRPEIDTIWRQDVRRALKLLDTPVPEPRDLSSLVEVLEDEGAILQAIYAAHDARLLSFDYEATGLHPALHELVCASFCYAPDRSHAFMMPASGPVHAAWAKLMSDPRVGKISHNMKFEDGWTRVHFELDGDINWAWDSMIAAHVVDNRVGICGLKLQSFLYLGIQSWDDEIEPYLKSTDPKDPRVRNRIWEFIDKYGERDCLVYCGIDSLTSYRLAMRQMETLGARAPA